MRSPSSMVPTRAPPKPVLVASALSGKSSPMVRLTHLSEMLYCLHLISIYLILFAEEQEHPEGVDEISLQYGTNKGASQAGSGGFGANRQIQPEGKHNLNKYLAQHLFINLSAILLQSLRSWKSMRGPKNSCVTRNQQLNGAMRI